MATESSTTPTAEISVPKQIEEGAPEPPYGSSEWIEKQYAREAHLREERTAGAIGYRFTVDRELILWEMLDLIPRGIRNGYSVDAFNLYVSALVRYVEGEKREIQKACTDTNRKVNEDLKWCADEAIEEIDFFVEEAKAALACAEHFTGKRILGGMYKDLLYEFHVMHVDEECHRVGTAMNAVNAWYSAGGKRPDSLAWFKENWDEWAPQWDSSREV